MSVAKVYVKQVWGNVAQPVNDGHEHPFGGGRGSYKVMNRTRIDSRTRCFFCESIIGAGDYLHFWVTVNKIPVQHRTSETPSGRSHIALNSHIACIAEQTFIAAFKTGIMIGADPEVELQTESGAIFYGDRLFTSMSDELGIDGAHVAVEFRPGPGNPDQVFAHIQRLMGRMGDILIPQQLKAIGGAGQHHPLGGHIHFSGLNYTNEMLTALDELVTEPMNGICNASRLRDRHNRGYGRNSAVRYQPHGWEYRSPVSWLAHPIVCKGALAAAYVIAAAEPMPTTKAQLIQAAGPWAADITAFYSFIATTKASRATLEEINILQAWGLIQESDLSEPRQVWGSRNDANVAEIVAGVRTTIRGLRVFGASSSRTADAAIYLSQDLYDVYQDGNARTSYIGGTVAVLPWTDSAVNSVFLSYSLRTNTVQARAALQAVIETVEFIQARATQLSQEAVMA